MGGWVYADVWEAIADLDPTATAQVQGERRSSWGDFDRRADGIAGALLAGGARHQDKVAMYLYNAPEYLETTFAASKAGLVPVNTNYRYRDDELVYLWDNADAVAVVFHGEFAERIEGLRDRVPRIKTWMWVDDGTAACPAWATPYEDAATSADERVVAPWGRDGRNDIFMIYTGGTTGIPKGVMWIQDDLYRAFNTVGDPEEPDLGAVVKRVSEGSRSVGLPGSPLMHATGFMSSLTVLNQGGCVALLPSRHFDADEVLSTIEREGVNVMAMVGDAFGRPLLAALDAAPGKYDLSSLQLLASAGVMWSAEVKEGLLRHLPGTLLADVLGSTEAHGMGTSISTAAGGATTAKFTMGANAAVVTEDGRVLEPGSEEIGLLAVKGHTPTGYYKDAEKSARTFLTIAGERFSVPGDWARIEADGTIVLLGRGSVCINTGGEKVFPEEVEEALKTHAGVLDATVVGVPDERFGEAICAAVVAVPGSGLEEGALIAHVKEHIAGYKAPKRIMFVETMGRGPNGKADYAGVRKMMIESMAAAS